MKSPECTDGSATRLDLAANKRWGAIQSCDVQAVGQFVYTAKSEGTYHSPICRHQPSKVEDIEFFDTCREARDAGYEACPNCYPDQAVWLVGAARWM